MIPTAQPITQYEVYPRTPPQAFKSQILAKQILLEGFCMKERIDPRLLPELVDAVMIDWELSEERHPDYTTATKHLLNHIRIKAHAQRNNPIRQGATIPRQDPRSPMGIENVAGAILRRVSAGKGNRPSD